MDFLRRIGLSLTTGYIFFFFGERIFWSLPNNPELNTPIDLMATWLVYSFFAYLCFIIIKQCRVRSVWAVFLVAALYGWLIEGVFSLTTFGIGSMPFPYSIVWTALAWHALCVMGGWYWMLQLLQTSTKKVLIGSMLLGIFWGVWSLYWPTTGLVSTPVNYLVYTLFWTALYILALHSYHWLSSEIFSATKTEKVILGLITLAWYCGFTVTQGGFLLPLTVLPILFGIIYFALQKNKRKETSPDVLTSINKRISFKRSVFILLAPLLATAIFSSGFYFPTNIPYLVTLSTLGIGMFVVSLYNVFRTKKSSQGIDK